MFAIKFLLIFPLCIPFVNAWEPECDKDTPSFTSKPQPQFDVAIGVDDSYEIRIRYKHDGLELDTLVLSIYMEDLTLFEEIVVPLGFFVEEGIAISTVSVQQEMPSLRYEVRARYSEFGCGPRVVLDFSADDFVATKKPAALE